MHLFWRAVSPVLLWHPIFCWSKSSVFLSIIPTCSVYLFSCYCSPLHSNCSTLVVTLLEIVFWMYTEGEKMRCDGTVTTGSCTNNHGKSWMVRQAGVHCNFNNSHHYYYYTTSFLIRNSSWPDQNIGNDFGYIRTICWAKTQDGASYLEKFWAGYHGRLWWVDEMKFNITQGTTNSHLLHKYDLIKMELGVDWLTVQC